MRERKNRIPKMFGITMRIPNNDISFLFSRIFFPFFSYLNLLFSFRYRQIVLQITTITYRTNTIDMSWESFSTPGNSYFLELEEQKRTVN